MKTIHCDISTVSQIEDDILLIEILADKDFEMKDFNQLMEAAKAIGGGKKFYNLVVIGAYTIPNHEARVASTSEEGSIYKLGDAFVIHSHTQKLVANFYMNFHKPYAPTKFFNDVESARIWLENLRENHRLSSKVG